MNSKEFFYLVAEMRSAQKSYFKSRDQRVLVVSKQLEKQVDAEIDRVRGVIHELEKEGAS